MFNPLEAAIGILAPVYAAKRSRARYAKSVYDRAQKRMYDGAGTGRRASAWRAVATSANAELGLALRPLRDRARELVRNTPHAARVLEIIVGAAIGTGITPVPNTGNERLDKRVSQLWNDWQDQADVEGELSFTAMQGLAVRSMVESGEVVLRFIDERTDPSVTPFKLQLLEADFIDQWREGVYGGPAGQHGLASLGLTTDTLRTRLGVGLGEYDRRTGLWLLPWHPGEITTSNILPGVSRFTPASELIHLYRRTRPGQVRGVTWFAPTMMTAKDFADLMDAVLVKARVEACFAGFITNTEEFDQVLDVNAAPSADGATGREPLVTTLEPGMLKELASGQDIKFAQPTNATQVEPMFLFNLMAMAVGVGCTYDQVTGDLRQANYSSLRAGKLDFRRSIEQFQSHEIIPRLCNRVWARFVDRSILAGLLRPRAGGYPVEWQTPAWEPINPKVDLDAEMQLVRAGRMTPQQFCASYGIDWRRMIEQFKEFYAVADKEGLVFDIDPRRTTQTGVAQADSKPLGEEPPSAKLNGKGPPKPPKEDVVDEDGAPLH